jgi:hypothetical protein
VTLEPASAAVDAPSTSAVVRSVLSPHSWRSSVLTDRSSGWTVAPMPWTMRDGTCQPFGLAVCRAALMRQSDPVATLRRVASLVRQGGHIAAVDLLFDPGHPRFDPPVPAVTRAYALHEANMRARGPSPDLAWHPARALLSGHAGARRATRLFVVFTSHASVMLDLAPGVVDHCTSLRSNAYPTRDIKDVLLIDRPECARPSRRGPVDGPVVATSAWERTGSVSP